MREKITENPGLMEEWDWEKNGELGLNPEEITAGSGKKAWWKCKKCGHEWYAVINGRSNGRGCPSCSNQVLVPGKNDLQTKYPDIAAQWHPTKNGNLKPYAIVYSSHRKVWWLCNTCGYEWKAPVNKRTAGHKCPCCSNKVVVTGINDLQTVRPDIAKEWHPTKNENLRPNIVTYGSRKKVWWLCDACGYEWQTYICKRAAGYKCPRCVSRIVVPGINDLQTKFPELAAEWHPTKNGNLTASQILPGSSKKVWWLCPDCGHEWYAGVGARKNGSGCPNCIKHRRTSFPEQAIYYYVKQVFPDAINRYTDLGFELDVYIPSIKTAIEYDGVLFHKNRTKKDYEKNEKCKEHKINLIRVREQGLAPFNNCVCITRENSKMESLTIVMLQLFKHLNINNVNIVLDEDSLKINEQCKGILYKNSFAECFPEAAKEWHPTKNGNLTPYMFSKKSGQYVWWLCSDCGYEWKTDIASRAKGHGCRKCGRKKSVESYLKTMAQKKSNSLKTA